MAPGQELWGVAQEGHARLCCWSPRREREVRSQLSPNANVPGVSQQVPMEVLPLPTTFCTLPTWPLHSPDQGQAPVGASAGDQSTPSGGSAKGAPGEQGGSVLLPLGSETGGIFPVFVGAECFIITVEYVFPKAVALCFCGL